MFGNRILKTRALHRQTGGAKCPQLGNHPGIARFLQVNIRRPTQKMRAVGSIGIEIVMRRQIQIRQTFLPPPVIFQPPLDLPKSIARRLKTRQQPIQRFRVLQLRLPVINQNIKHIIAHHPHPDFPGAGDFHRPAPDKRRNQPLNVPRQPLQHIPHAQTFPARIPQWRTQISLIIQFPPATQPNQKRIQPRRRMIIQC